MLRYGSVNVPLTGAGVIIYGTILLSSPASSFAGNAYQQGPFLLAGQHAWAIAFIGAGLLALTVRRLLAIFPLLLFVAGWAIAMVLAALTGDNVAPTAGLAWAIIAAELLVSVSIRGITAPGR